MIKILNSDIDQTIKYLNENYPTEKSVPTYLRGI